MIDHHNLRSKDIFTQIKNGAIQFAGNRKLKIYGLLTCSSGKRMSVNNRVFFKNESEAIQSDYRPCGHCMKSAYRKWKNGIV